MVTYGHHQNPTSGEARKIKASQILHKRISTQLLTVLIMCVILHAEQRRAAKKHEFPTPDRFPAGQNKTGQQDGG